MTKKPLQNRVTPYGRLIATPAKGTLMGNRGVLHNHKRQIVTQRTELSRWIICSLDYEGEERKVMSPGCYTELFFLDEATALSAGHRPCATCRRNDYEKFRYFWLRGNPVYGFDESVRIGAIDEVMDEQRLLNEYLLCKCNTLPNGVFVALPQKPEQAYLLWKSFLWLWSPEGYGEQVPFEQETEVMVLTPPSTVEAIRVGYVPVVALEV